jgi:PAS domain S-box-containing protein
MFWKSKKQIDKERLEEEQRRKVLSSQVLLLEAATTTASAANHVTTQLKKHLEDSIKQFETTMKIINDALLICDENGTIRALNSAAEIVFACKSSELLMKNIRILFEMQNTENFWDELTKDSTKGLRQNGEIFSIDIKIEKMTKADESVVYLIVIVDMTNINKNKKDSKELEQRYHILFDQCVDGIIILQDNKIIASNKASRKLLNNTVKIENIKLLLGETVELTDKSGNIEFILSGANITWNDASASFITIKDIRGLKSFESKINEIDMIVCFDKNFIITYVNEQYSFYYNKTKNSLIGTDIRKLFDQTELATFLVSINSLTKESPMKKIQVHVEKDGNMVLQDWVDFANFNDDELVEYQRNGRDITEALKSLSRK